MRKHHQQVQETLQLIKELSKELEAASKEKLSTNDITPDRLLWEIFNKVFSILVICGNSLLTKDSLTIHLVARYTYEMLIVFAFIFLDKVETGNRVSQFVQFNQFKNTKRMWTDKTFAQMVNSIPNNSRFNIHKTHYRNLSNFAHPTMDSFLLNRRGDESESLMILSTTLLTIGTILEIIKICFEENLYFTHDQQKMINLASLSTATDKIMKEIRAK